MMLIFFVLYVLLCICGIRLNAKKETNYLSIENTAAIKGVFILLVFFSHFNSYLEFANHFDKTYKGIVDVFGQTMVTMFLFYSGYGVMESIKKKGESYVNYIPTKRVLATLLKFDCAVILFLIIGVCSKESYTFKQVLLSFFAWDTLGNSNWYIFVILLLYLISYVVFKFNKKRSYLSSVLITLFVICTVIATNVYFDIKPYFWYDTALCYVLGMVFSLKKAIVEKFVNRNVLSWLITTSVLTVICVLLYYNRNSLTNMILNIMFCMLVISITMKVSLKNSILVWCGKNLFELYILQRIPMIILKKIGLMEYNIYLYFICCVICTLLLVVPFKYVTGILIRKIESTTRIIKRM